METGYFKSSLIQYDEPKNILIESLQKLGIPVYAPSGTYFLIADFKKYLDVAMRAEGASHPGENPDYIICRWLTKTFKVTAIPCSAFYSVENQALATSLVRFCFAKTTETIRQALERLQGLSNL